MESTNIEWCDSTINGSSGCDGCELWSGKTRICYAGQMHENRLARSLPELYAKDFSEVRMIPGRYAKAAAWSDLSGTQRLEKKDKEGKVVKAAKPWLDGLPRMIFVGDMADTFSKAVTDEYLKRELIGAIESKGGQRHFWLLLTKQIRRLADFSEMLGGLPENVMAMTTVTSQRTADVRLPELLRVKAKWRGVSAEPLLGPVSLKDWLWPVHASFPGRYSTVQEAIKDGAEVRYKPQALVSANCRFVNWVIIGGASGHQAKPMHPLWARRLGLESVRSNTSLFFKQWGEWEPVTPLYSGRDEEAEDGRGELEIVTSSGHLWDPEIEGQPNDPHCWLMEKV